MCVAVVIRGASPSLADLLDMEADNPHGAGIAWKPDGKNRVLYRKGMTAKEVSEVLDALPRPVLLHFRWATHGSQKKALTHPFPLGVAALLNTNLEGSARGVLIHNGVWNGYAKHVPKWARGLDLSDTAVAAYVAAHNPDILREVHWSTAVGKARGAAKPMLVKLRGDWTEYGAEEGRPANLFSNLKWRGAATKPYRGLYGNWEDYWGDGYMVTPAPARYTTTPKTYKPTRWRKNPLTQVWELLQGEDDDDVLASTKYTPVGYEDDGRKKPTPQDIADALIDATLREVAESELEMKLTGLNDDTPPPPDDLEPEVPCDIAMGRSYDPQERRRQSMLAYASAKWDPVEGRWVDPSDDEDAELRQQEVYSG